MSRNQCHKRRFYPHGAKPLLFELSEGVRLMKSFFTYHEARTSLSPVA